MVIIHTGDGEVCTIGGVNFGTQRKYSIHKVTYESIKLGHLEKSSCPEQKQGQVA
jgi:hypothetical protein